MIQNLDISQDHLRVGLEKKNEETDGYFWNLGKELGRKNYLGIRGHDRCGHFS